MKFSANREDLLEGLQQVQNVVSSRTTLPILGNVLIETTEAGVQLTTTDLEVGIQCFVPATIQDPGATTLPVKRLTSIVKELSSETVDFETDERCVSTIACSGSVFRVVGLSDEDFPPLPALGSGQQFKIPQRRLREILKQTSYAISNDENRYVLNGLLFHIQSNKLTVVATDGRRLALAEEEIEWTGDDLTKVILPAKAVHELERILGSEGEAEVFVMSPEIAFDLDGTLLISKLIEGQFPNFQQVVPSDSAVRVFINRIELLQALRRVSLLLNDRNLSVNMTFSRDRMEIEANAPEVGDARDEVPVRCDADELKVSFNPNYLMDPLRQLDVDEVILEISDYTSPGVLKTDSMHFLYVLMPMRYKTSEAE
jgi:DNA polymerase-3 subunit beta